MSEEEGIRQFESQFGDLDPELESSFRKYIVDRDEPYYEAINKRLLPSHLQDCIKDGVCPNRGYTPIPPTPTQKGEMNRDRQEWGAESMISGQTLASVGGTLAIGAGLAYMLGDNIITNRFLRQRQSEKGNDLILKEINKMTDEERELQQQIIKEDREQERNRIKNRLKEIEQIKNREPERIKDEDMFENPKGRPTTGGTYLPSKKQKNILSMVKELVNEGVSLIPQIAENEKEKERLLMESIVPQQAKPETTQSQQETQSVVPAQGLGIFAPTSGDPRLQQETQSIVPERARYIRRPLLLTEREEEMKIKEPRFGFGVPLQRDR